MTKQQKVDLILQIADACEKLNWVIGLATDEHSEKVPGLILGTQEFVSDVMNRYEPNNVELYSTSKTTAEIIEHEPLPVKVKKKNMKFH